MAEVASSGLSAKRLNERVRVARNAYYKRLVALFKAAMMDGYIVGTEPARSRIEEYLALHRKRQGLTLTAIDETLPFGRRERAQRELQRLIELDQEFGLAEPS